MEAEKKTEYLVCHPDELRPVAANLLAHARGRTIFAFSGELGAGKTTLIQVLCRELGIEDAVTSPTFSIVNEYHLRSETDPPQVVYHLDLYRVKNLEEALDAGLMEYLDSGSICFVEWPQVAEVLLPPDTVSVHLSVTAGGCRKILSL